MAKEKMTVEQIRSLLTRLNPKKFGANANPTVPGKTKFILTGIMRKGKDNKEVAQFQQTTVLSDEAKAANPNLTPTRYLRVMKTDDIQSVSNSTDVLRTGRRPLADNIFERQQPVLYNDIVSLLKKKTEVDGKVTYEHFEVMTPDDKGNPRIKLLNPVLGCFVSLNVPGHFKIGTDGKIMQASRKDLLTGKFSKPEKVVFREDKFFVYEHEIDSIEAIAIGRYQKLIEPMLAEEIIMTVDEGGNIQRREIQKHISAEAPDTGSDETPPELLGSETTGDILD